MPHLDTATFEFIADLRRNNNRDWFEDNRDRYEMARADFNSFIGVWLIEIEKFDDSVTGMDPRRCMFRIYRDTRFSTTRRRSNRISAPASCRAAARACICVPGIT